MISLRLLTALVLGVVFRPAAAQLPDNAAPQKGFVRDAESGLPPAGGQPNSAGASVSAR